MELVVHNAVRDGSQRRDVSLQPLDLKHTTSATDPVGSAADDTCTTASAPFSEPQTPDTFNTGVLQPLTAEDALQRLEDSGTCIGDANDALEQHNSSLATIRQHCCENRLLVAMEALNALELDVAATLKMGAPRNQDGVMDSVAKFSEALSKDGELIKLRSIHSRLDLYLQPNGLLAASLRGSDSSWAVACKREPRIGEHFRMECRMRFLEPSERSEDGGTTQVMFCIILENWPQRLEEFVCMDREVDLMHKDVVEDCRSMCGEVGGPDMLRSSMLYYVIRPALLPMSFACLNIREYAVCHESPVLGFSPGVFVVENTPPLRGGTMYEGFRLPPDKWATKKVIRNTIKHIATSKDHPGCSNQRMVSTAGIPVPQWMVPLHLLVAVILNTTIASFINFKLELADKWEEAGFAKRMADAPDFYGAVRSVGSDAS